MKTRLNLLTVIVTMLLVPVGLVMPRESSSWEVTSQYQIEIDHKLSEGGKVFRAQGRASLLLLDPALGTPLIIELRNRIVRTVDEARMNVGPESSTVQLPDEAILDKTMPYTLRGESAIFFLQDRRIRVFTKAPLVGTPTIDQILAHSPLYIEGMSDYSPSEDAVGHLKKVSKPVTIEVYFGTWCPHCKEIVPKFLKSMESVANPMIQVAFNGMPRPPWSSYAPAMKRNIRGVPTFVVLSGDRELGRFSKIPSNSSVEREIAKILN